MDLRKYDGKRIKIVADDGKVFIGKVIDYFYPDENESGNEGIGIRSEDGRLIEFEEKDIQTIEILEE